MKSDLDQYVLAWKAGLYDSIYTQITTPHVQKSTVVGSLPSSGELDGTVIKSWLGKNKRLLQQLWYVNIIGDPNITTLPEELQYCRGDGTTNLTFDFHGNGLTSVPDWIFGIAGLDNLKLQNNKITSLPSSFPTIARTANFYIMDLENNSLSSVPQELFCTAERIFLNNNELTTIPLPAPCVSGKLVTELQVNNNKISDAHILSLWKSQLGSAFGCNGNPGC